MSRAATGIVAGVTSFHAHSKSTVGAGAVTTLAGGWVALSDVQTVLGIIAASIGIVATLATLYMQVRWHRRRMRNNPPKDR